MVIFFVGFFPGFGGAERSIIKTANSMANWGHDVTILVLGNYNMVYSINTNVKVIHIPDVKSNRLFKVLYRFYCLLRLTYSHKINCIVSFWLQPAIMFALLRIFKDFKVVYSERGDPSDKEYSGLLKLLRNYFIKKFDGIVFQSEAAKNYFPNIFGNKSILINNSLDSKIYEYNLCSNVKSRIINVGRLHPQKNQDLLIKAFKEVHNLFPDHTLDIYGEGDQREFLENLISELKLINFVKLRGATDNIYDELTKSSLFILTSNYEGMPNALLEAMAVGLPCISTDFRPGNVSEIICNGYNGIICSNNSINSLANSIIYVFENYDKAKLMGQSAKQSTQKYKEEIIFSQWHDFLTKINYSV